MNGDVGMAKPFEGATGKLTLRPITLIIDDERDYGKAMQDALSTYGFEVHLAHSASDALHTMQTAAAKPQQNTQALGKIS